MPVWTSVYWDDWVCDTQHLDLIEQGAYFRLIALYYQTEGPLSTDMRRLYRAVGAMGQDEQQAVETVLEQYFTRTDDGWRHDRCDRELAEDQRRRSNARRAARTRWGTDESGGNADAMPAQCDRISGGNADGYAERMQPTPRHPHPDTHTQTPDTQTHTQEAPESPSPPSASSAAADSAESERFIPLPLNDGSLYHISEDQVSRWEGLYPAVDVRQSLRNMLGWLEANPERRKTRRGVTRFVTNWLAREQDRGGTRTGQSRQRSGGSGADEWLQRGRTFENGEGTQ